MEHSLLSKAFVLANEQHAGQIRKGFRRGFDLPYIVHPTRVATRIIEWGCKDERIIVAAFLHDTIEDTCKNEMERGQLMDKIAEIDEFSLVLVLRLTNPDGMDDLPREERNRVYASHVVEAIVSSPEALLIKISDFFDNAGNLPEGFENLRNKYRPVRDILFEAVSNGKLGTIVPKNVQENILLELEALDI